MTGTRRVVVGVSGSPASILALRVGGAQACRDDIPLVAVHAWVPPGGELAARRAPAPAELRGAWKQAALQRLQDAVESAWGGLPGDLRVEHVLARGPAGPVLVDIADCADDLLVVGAGPRGALTRLLGGRVTRYCQARAKCPTLAVPPPALAAGRNRLRGWWFRRHELTADQFLRDLERLGPPSR